MLVQFTVENFRSLRETTTLSLRSTKDGRLLKHVVTNAEGQGGKAIGVLRAAAIYGANAAGKSNLVLAMAFARRLIIEGTSPNATIPVHLFKLDKELAARPSRFEFIFRHRDTLYSYGFAVDAHRIHEEWLFATAGKREFLMFERATDEDNKVQIEFGTVFRKAVAQEAVELGVRKGAFTRVDNLAADTRPNQLFLSACIERNVGAVNPVHEWFTEVLEIITAESLFMPLTWVSHYDQKFTSFISEFLRAAGTGIQGLTTELEPLDFDRHFPGVEETERQEMESEMSSLKPGEGMIWKDDASRRVAVTRDKEGNLQFISFYTLHKNAQGETIRFRLEEESDGTQRLFDLIPALFMARILPKVWVVDELDRRLHPLLTRLLVKAALNCPADSPEGQFIFTTHDTNLLDLDLLRRDEIWFVEKDTHGATHLASLAEWKIRPDLEIEKGYLSGRFGAIPFFGDPSRLLCEPQVADGVESGGAVIAGV